MPYINSKLGLKFVNNILSEFNGAKTEYGFN